MLNLEHIQTNLRMSTIIALILKELRLLKNASQQQISDKLNIERSTYTKWETGQISLRVDQLQEIANLYGIDFEFMARCINAGKLISINDVKRFIYLQEQKELRINVSVEGGVSCLANSALDRLHVAYS